jgi:hypothetical protein
MNPVGGEEMGTQKNCQKTCNKNVLLQHWSAPVRFL